MRGKHRKELPKVPILIARRYGADGILMHEWLVAMEHDGSIRVGTIGPGEQVTIDLDSGPRE